MISTSSHNNCKTDKYRIVSISRNKGKDAVKVHSDENGLIIKADKISFLKHNERAD